LARIAEVIGILLTSNSAFANTSYNIFEAQHNITRHFEQYFRS